MKYIITLFIMIIAAAGHIPAQTSGQASSMASLSAGERAIVKRLLANMVDVKGGKYVMGATSGQAKHAYAWEMPTHEVNMADFKIGRYEVTQEEWEAVMGENPSLFKGAKRPVERVCWDDCQQFIARLNKLTGMKFRLPTEEEWEYAARGGIKSNKDTRFAGSDLIDDVAWYYGNSGRTTHEVGGLQPNELGLYDMSGNVSEWCDGFCDNVRGYDITPDKKLTQRTRRGGNWDRIATFCRNSYRYGRKPDFRAETIGLRLALSE